MTDAMPATCNNVSEAHSRSCLLQGYTAVHEIGHWLSLLHPFEGGCSEPNDGCTDTAETAQPIMTCPSAAVSTCPHKPKNQPASDPIHNYMVRQP